MESFLSAGRIDTGKIELTLVDCSLKKLMEQAIQRQKLSSQHHRFDADISALPAVVRCDALAISQVLTNLLSNAVKYAPHALDIEVRGWTEEGFAFISCATMASEKNLARFMPGRQSYQDDKFARKISIGSPRCRARQRM